MSVGEVILQARKSQGLTQDELAAKVYVTRQAVSRWETGESAPSIDMRKLLASVLNLPVTDLLELPNVSTCQCCGTPFTVPNMPKGTNADGSENPDYCAWCYQDGAFTSESLDALIERNVPYLMAATGYTEEEAVSFMGALAPSLKRWQEVENRNKSAKATRGAFYACPDCGNIVWSMGEVAASCCGKPLHPLVPRSSEGVLRAEVSVSDNKHFVRVEHPMTKDDHLLFIACVGDDLTRIKRLYAEQEATASFFIEGPCKFYAYGASCGLLAIKA